MILYILNDLGSFITSPIWIPFLIFIAIIIGFLSIFGLLLALTSPPFRTLAYRFYFILLLIFYKYYKLLYILF